MKHSSFPRPFRHVHPPVQDVNRIVADRASAGQRAADRVATVVGSWRFIVGQSLLLLLWALLNVTMLIQHWDPYPFIAMNLILSLQAAFTAPVIMMSQNRQAARDRIEAHNDFLINVKAEQEVRAILEHLAAQNVALTEIQRRLTGLEQKGFRP